MYSTDVKYSKMKLYSSSFVTYLPVQKIDNYTVQLQNPLNLRLTVQHFSLHLYFSSNSRNLFRSGALNECQSPVDLAQTPTHSASLSLSTWNRLHMVPHLGSI